MSSLGRLQSQRLGHCLWLTSIWYRNTNARGDVFESSLSTRNVSGTFPGQHTMTMLLNWKRCTQKLATTSPVAQFKVLFTSSFSKFCWSLSEFWKPLLRARHRFRNLCCLRKHLTKVVLRLFGLLCFIPILHSKTWVVHMAANIEVTSVNLRRSDTSFEPRKSLSEFLGTFFNNREVQVNSRISKKSAKKCPKNAQLQRFNASKTGLANYHKRRAVWKQRKFVLKTLFLITVYVVDMMLVGKVNDLIKGLMPEFWNTFSQLACWHGCCRASTPFATFKIHQ